jgi:hypothetical protein
MVVQLLCFEIELLVTQLKKLVNKNFLTSFLNLYRMLTNKEIKIRNLLFDFQSDGISVEEGWILFFQFLPN